MLYQENKYLKCSVYTLIKGWEECKSKKEMSWLGGNIGSKLGCSPEIQNSTPFYIILTIPIGRLPPYVVMLFSEGQQRRNS
jgi:hypothetical protein